MLRFAAPWLLALVVPTLLCGWWVARRRRRVSAALRLPTAGAGLRLGRSPWQSLDALVPWIRTLALVLLVVALARPQAGERLETITTHGVDIVVALDISGSMRAEDFQPDNRLAVAKRTVDRFVQARGTDRIGLVVFAEVAATRCPLTLDHEMLRELLERVDFAPQRQAGTAIGMGLAAAVNRLRAADAASRVVVLLTDGRNNRGQIGPDAAADAARALGIRVYTIGIGSEGEVPIPQDYGPLGTRRVMQRLDLDEALLQRVATTTGGRYFRASDAVGLGEVFTTIDELETSEIESRVRTMYTELFGVPLLPAIGLLLLERLLLGTRLRRIP